MRWFGWSGAARGGSAANRSVRLLILALAAVATTAGCTPTIVDGPGPVVLFAAGVGPGLGDDAMVQVARVDDTSGARRYEIVQVSRDGRSWRSADYQPVPAIPTGTHAPDVVIIVTEVGAQDPAAGWYEAPPCETVDGRPCPTFPEPEVEAAMTVARDASARACSADGRRCWRVVPGRLAIEESIDGSAIWHTVWSVSGPQRERYAALLTAQASRVDGYPITEIDRELDCTGIYVDPRSGSVVAACGLAGFVSRDPDGEWTMLGFDGGRSGRFFLDEPTASDTLNLIKILLGGWFILLLGAEARALRQPRGAPPGPRRWVAVIVSLGAAPLLLTNRVDTPAEGTVAWLWAACLLIGTLVWGALYVTGRRELPPWWTVTPAIAAATAGWYLHRLVVAGAIYPALGWLGIWTLLSLALATSIALGILLPRRPPATAATTP